MRALWAVCSVSALGLVAAGAARAQSGPALHWVRAPGAESCVPPAELARAVEAELGAAIFATATDAELALEGYVSPAEGGFQALLQVSDRDGKVLGSRTIASPGADCRALDEALTLVIVLTLDPDAGLLGGGIDLPDDVQARLDDALSQLDQAIENGQVPATSAPVIAKKPVVKPAPAPARSAVPQRSWELETFGGASFGATPAVSWTLGMRTGWQPASWPLFELSALFMGPSGVVVEREAPVRIDIVSPGGEPAPVGSSGSTEGSTALIRAWGAALALHACIPRGPEPRVRVRLCGGLEAGLLRAWAEGFLHDTHKVFPQVALSAASAIELPLGERWVLSAELGALLPLTRPELVYETVQGRNRSVFLTSPVIGRTLLVVGLRL